MSKTTLEAVILVTVSKQNVILKFGLLHPLEGPESQWTDLGFDYIVDLSEVDGMSIIAVVVDRLTNICSAHQC
jgi:hypothetical protein